jgi:hypothetical protein
MSEHNRFEAFNPEERSILRVLLQSHADAVSDIALDNEIIAADYIAIIEALWKEANNASR